MILLDVTKYWRCSLLLWYFCGVCMIVCNSVTYDFFCNCYPACNWILSVEWIHALNEHQSMLTSIHTSFWKLSFHLTQPRMFGPKKVIPLGKTIRNIRTLLIPKVCGSIASVPFRINVYSFMYIYYLKMQVLRFETLFKVSVKERGH